MGGTPSVHRTDSPRVVCRRDIPPPTLAVSLWSEPEAASEPSEPSSGSPNITSEQFKYHVQYRRNNHGTGA